MSSVLDGFGGFFKSTKSSIGNRTEGFEAIGPTYSNNFEALPFLAFSSEKEGRNSPVLAILSNAFFTLDLFVCDIAVITSAMVCFCRNVWKWFLMSLS